jgi:hypothetical protein
MSEWLISVARQSTALFMGGSRIENGHWVGSTKYSQKKELTLLIPQVWLIT